MSGKGKFKTKIKEEKETISIKKTGHTKPQFAHNASSAGKGMTWSYEFWKNSDPTKKGSFDIEGDVNKLKKMDENKQSTAMNNAAKSLIQKEYPNCTAKIVG